MFSLSLQHAGPKDCVICDTRSASVNRDDDDNKATRGVGVARLLPGARGDLRDATSTPVLQRQGPAVPTRGQKKKESLSLCLFSGSVSVSGLVSVIVTSQLSS